MLCYPGEATADELLSRLQQVKEGQEQQNSAPSNDRGEEPIGKVGSFCHQFGVAGMILDAADFSQSRLKALRIPPVSWIG